MNCIEHVFKLRRKSIEPSFVDRTQELRNLLDVLERVAQNYPKKVFYEDENYTWFYNEDDQTRGDWERVREMLEVLEIPTQHREFGLFGFHLAKLPGELVLQNFDFLREILPAPEETEFEIQRMNSTILQMLGSQITCFTFGHSTLEVTTDVVLVLSNDETENLGEIPQGMTVWEFICTRALFTRPVKYIVVHSLSTHLSPKGKIEKKYSAQINLVWRGDSK